MGDRPPTKRGTFERVVRSMLAVDGVTLGGISRTIGELRGRTILEIRDAVVPPIRRRTRDEIDREKAMADARRYDEEHANPEVKRK